MYIICESFFHLFIHIKNIIMLSRGAVRLQKQYKVGLIGASGAVGSRFLKQLCDHPWFDVVAMAGAPAEVGKKYTEVSEKLYTFHDRAGTPPKYANQVIMNADPEAFKSLGVDLVFSAVPDEVAIRDEKAFADAGIPVFTNCVPNRMKHDIPLLQPYINSEHIHLVKQQESYKISGGKGFIAANPNCSTIAMTVGLRPILDAFGLDQVMATTLQGISGSGYPGLPFQDMYNNVVPYIGGEEDKMEEETAKILGKLTDDGIEFEKNVVVSASCNRVQVSDGHLINVAVKLQNRPGSDEELVQKAIEAFQNFKPPQTVMDCISCPEQPVLYIEKPDRPQQRLDAMYAGGMGVTIGRVRPCNVFDLKFMVLGHNTIIGAAGGSILNAELFIKAGYIQ